MQINETKGEHSVEGKFLDSAATDYGLPIKTKKHNIGTGDGHHRGLLGQGNSHPGGRFAKGI
jgi:hypothetical protein